MPGMYNHLLIKRLQTMDTDKHVSPGRFLAVTEMKLILAVLILGYDLKLVPGSDLKLTYIGTSRIPDTQFPVLFKAR